MTIQSIFFKFRGVTSTSSRMLKFGINDYSYCSTYKGIQQDNHKHKTTTTNNIVKKNFFPSSLLKRPYSSSHKEKEIDNKKNLPPQLKTTATKTATTTNNVKPNSGLDWNCKHTWKRASINTTWCLIGCSIGEFSTLGMFQLFEYTEVSAVTICLPVINGLATSILLETGILHFGPSNLSVKLAFKTAMGMSFVSMVAMELAMESMDFFLTGGMQMNLYAIPPMLIAGFLAPLPFNYWRLKKFGKACH